MGPSATRRTSSFATSAAHHAKVGHRCISASSDDIVLIKRLDTSSNVIFTESKPSAFPSSLRAKRSEVQTVTDEETQNATIRETCGKCGREEVRYYTQQLRSADEGTTVFFHCECGHKYASQTRILRWNTDGVAGGHRITERIYAMASLLLRIWLAAYML
jgi:DNA-directed RNA polymerase subunit M/transcription elongation factor TFIIS